MRISRPCYDKPHRCPGWAGGGMRYARRQRCPGALLGVSYGPGWRWRFHRCGTCGVIVLPSNVRWLDPGWWRAYVSRKVGR